MLVEGGLALVTGASSGIGKAIATALAARGMRVLMAARDSDRLRAASAAAGPNAIAIVADVTTEAGRLALAAQTGPELHVLIHSAGAYARFNISELPDDRWNALAAVNLHAPMLLTAVCLPHLRVAFGQVVFVNSTAALSASAGLSAYAATKRGLQAATDAFRQEVNSDGIRVLSVFPGRTDTPMQQRILQDEQRKAPPGTLMQPEDVASTVLAALDLPRTSEITDIMMRPMRKL